MDPSRRADEPAFKVVGFVIEGKSPSPLQHSALADWEESDRQSSPAPVRVPPPIVETKPPTRPLVRSISNPTHSGLTSSITVGIQGSDKPGAGAAELGSLNLRGSSLMSSIPPNLPLTTASTKSSVEPSTETIAEHAPATTATTSATTATSSQDTAEHASGATSAQQGPPAKEGKSQKEMTKAERRALQEAQRAKKAASKAAPGGKAQQAADGAPPGGKAAAAKAAAGLERPNSTGSTSPKPAANAAHAKPAASVSSSKAAKKAPGVSVKPSEMFAHLPQYKKLDISDLVTKDLANIHSAVLALGLRYASGAVKGGNTRCVAMLHVVCQVIQDYSTPEGKTLSRDLQAVLNTQIAFLVSCRPLCASMGNAIRFLKLHISKIDPATPEHQAKAQLIELISNFIQEKVVVADKALVEHAVTNIHDGDTILIYSYSHIVLQALLEAQQRGRAFTVVVVDSQPETEGRRSLKLLMAAGVPCTYVFITSAASVMRQVTTVFVGASAVLSNGTVIAQAGTACVAFMAHSHHKPVVVCCETYKFHERVQLDSIIHNELGDPDALASRQWLQDWREVGKLELLNLKYDALPKEYVTMVATEFGAIPASSVPVILREYRQDS